MVDFLHSMVCHQSCDPACSLHNHEFNVQSKLIYVNVKHLIAVSLKESLVVLLLGVVELLVVLLLAT